LPRLGGYLVTLDPHVLDRIKALPVGRAKATAAPSSAWRRATAARNEWRGQDHCSNPPPSAAPPPAAAGFITTKPACQTIGGQAPRREAGRRVTSVPNRIGRASPSGRPSAFEPIGNVDGTE